MRSFSYDHIRIPNNQVNLVTIPLVILFPCSRILRTNCSMKCRNEFKTSISLKSRNHVKTMQGNHVHALGGTVTSVNFMSDSSGCEKWPNVSNKRYVEEAKSYTQPGSVAEKKAFFDAYYKKIAAQKAAAAALLEQEKAAAAAAAAANAHQVTTKVADLVIDNNIVDAGTKNTKRPLLKLKPNANEVVRQPVIKKKPASSSWVASINHGKDNISTPRTKTVTTNDYTDKRRLAPKSLKVLMNSSFVKESCGKTQSIKPASSVNSTPKRSATPMKTPAKAFVNWVDKQPLATHSLSIRMETPAHSAVGRKLTGPKWHILSAGSKSLTESKLKSPIISSPFMLRTEDRAARRKQKLEEKFNEKQAHVVHQKAQFKEKAETELRTMRESSCFKAPPLPDFYKGQETPEKLPRRF